MGRPRQLGNMKQQHRESEGHKGDTSSRDTSSLRGSSVGMM